MVNPGQFELIQIWNSWASKYYLWFSSEQNIGSPWQQSVHISIGLSSNANKCQAYFDSDWSCKINRTRPMVVFTSGWLPSLLDVYICQLCFLIGKYWIPLCGLEKAIVTGLCVSNFFGWLSPNQMKRGEIVLMDDLLCWWMYWQKTPREGTVGNHEL